jgi:hypothetical protein
MMSRRFAALALLISGAAPIAANAQSASAQCLAQAAALRDACQKGSDIFAMIAPQVNGALTGGGPVLGSSRSGGVLSIGLRVNAVDGRVPELTSVTLSPTALTRSTIATKRAPVPAPALDVSLALFPGIFVGVQRVLSLDALVNVAYIPSRTIENFSVKTTNGSLKLGYGGRLGLLADRMLMPAIAVSFFRRSLPTASFSTSFSSSIAGITTRDTIALENLSIENDALRLSLSKKLGFLELGGGVGQDRYRTFTQIRARVSPSVGPQASGTVAVSQTLKRNAAYGSVALNIFKLRIGAEAGATFGGDSVQTYNTFTDGKLNAQRMFGSAGLRLSF